MIYSLVEARSTWQLSVGRYIRADDRNTLQIWLAFIDPVQPLLGVP
jgi:hypothetical protein